MDSKAELEILEALDAGEISKEEATSLLGSGGNAPDPISDEMHPDIGFINRAIYKNFGDQGEAGLNFLKKKLPEMEFKQTDDGVIARKPGEAEWKRLDEKGFGLQDISDGVYDVGSGIAEGIAGVGAGLATAWSGPGALVAGAGAAGATGAGLEYGRQGIGQMLGVHGDVNHKDAAISGAFGTVSPLLLGTGASTKAMGKQALKNVMKSMGGDVSEEALQQAAKQVAQTQRGLVSKGLGNSSAWLGQMASGIDSGTLKYARQNLDKIRAAENSGTGGAEIYTVLQEKIEDGIQTRLEQSGKKIAETIDSSNIEVDIADVESPLMELLLSYEKKALKTIEKHGDNASGKKDFIKYEQLKKSLEPFLEGEGKLKGSEVKGYLDNLNEITGIAKNRDTALLQGVKKDLQRVSKQAAKKLDDQASKGADGAAWKAAKQEYAELKSIENDVLKKYFKDDQSTERTLNTLLSRKGKSKKLGINKALDKLDIDIDETAQESVANSLFINPNMDPLSSMGTTSTSRSVPLGGLGGMLGYFAGGKVGGGHGGGAVGAGIGAYAGSKIGSPYSMRKFMQADERVKNIWQSMQDTGQNVMPMAPRVQSGINVWRNLSTGDE